MDSDNPRKIDELADDLDELKTIADELEDDPPPNVKQDTVEKLKRALENAGDAADDLENQEED